MTSWSLEECKFNTSVLAYLSCIHVSLNVPNGGFSYASHLSLPLPHLQASGVVFQGFSENFVEIAYAHTSFSAFHSTETARLSWNGNMLIKGFN